MLTDLTSKPDSLLNRVLSSPPDSDPNPIRVHPLTDNFVSGWVGLSCRVLLRTYILMWYFLFPFPYVRYTDFTVDFSNKLASGLNSTINIKFLIKTFFLFFLNI